MTQDAHGAGGGDANGGSGAGSMSGVARGGALNAFGAVVSGVLGLVLTVVIARGYSREVAGVFFSSTSAFLVLVAVGQLGTNVGLVYFVSRSRAVQEERLVPGYLRSAAVPVLLWSVALAVGVFLTAPLIGGLIGPDEAESTTRAVRVLAPFVVAAAVENLSVSATRGLGTMRPTALLTLVLRPATQVVLVLGAVVAAGPGAAVGAWGAGYLVSAMFAVVWMRRLLGPGLLARGTGERVARPFWTFTAPRAFVTVAQIAMQRLDIVLVGALAGAPSAAVYAATTRFLVAGQMGTQSVSLASQPRFAHHLAVGDRVSAERLYRMSTAWLVLIAWPLYLTLAVFSTTVLGIFGSGYVEGAPVLVILVGALMFGAVVGVVEVVLVMAGRPGWTLVNSLVALTVLVGIDLWLIPKYGATGAAVGWAVAIVTRNTMALIQVRLTTGMHPFGRESLVAVVICLVGVGGPLVMSRWLVGGGVLALVLGLLGAAVCHGSGTWLLRSTLQVPELMASLRRRGRPG